MNGYRQLPLSRLGHLVPPLIGDAALVALMPVTDDLTWAAKAAWDIARIAARDGRRVALVDLYVDHPALHEIVGLQPSEGIVDAFEYGVSLNKAAHEVLGVFFIPAGSDTAHTTEVYAHPRWPKLQAGFRSEGALLLVFLPPAGFARFSAMPDGVIVLAPEGLTGGLAIARDVPLLGVVRDRWLPSGPRITSPPLPIPMEHEPQTPRWGLRVAALALVVAALAVGGWALLARARESAFLAPPPAPAATSTTPTNLQPPPPAPPPPDTLAWTVQLAAYASLEKALDHADRLAADAGVPALVTPVPQKAPGSVWYRVQAGSYATRADAAEARADLWRRGIAAEGIGDLLHAPYSYRAPTTASLDQLRRRSLPAVRWSNGLILLGAFETPEQAAFTQAALKRAGVRATLLPRMGTGTP